jgi:hypothetical protein
MHMNTPRGWRSYTSATAPESIRAANRAPATIASISIEIYAAQEGQSSIGIAVSPDGAFADVHGDDAAARKAACQKLYKLAIGELHEACELLGS